ncbi:MAG TPA: ABC transporter permease [Aggregatilineales bacterium]|nr:ABC transporter permease [Aggregatilineales bacterium]
MSSITSLTLESRPTELRTAGRLRLAWKWLRTHPGVTFGLAILLFWMVGTLIAPAVISYDPLAPNINDSLAAPGIAHIWGADKLGRDIFTRVLYGTRISLPAGIIAVLASLFIGTAIGAVAGYMGGWGDELLMRVTDIFLAFPSIILAMAIAAALGPSITNAILTIAIVAWPNYARVTRGLVLSVKQNEYVEASRAIGASHFRILFRTILPNCLGPLIVLATIDLGNAILLFAGLSFLGLGPAPEVPEWGRLIADGIQYSDQWWVSAFPGLAIFSSVMALNFIGDGLRDVLDPRTRRR